MPGYKRDLGNGKYRLEVSNGFRADGKPNRASKVVEAASDRTADKLLQEFYLEFSKKPPQVKTRITFKEFTDVWRAKHTSKVSPNTLNGYESLLELYITPYFSAIQLKRISATVIISFFDDLADEQRPQCDKLSKGTLFNVYSLLRSMFNKALEWGYIAENPCMKIPKEQRPKKVYAKPPILEEDQLTAMLQALFSLHDNATNTKHQLFFYLMLLDGCRTGEQLALTWSDINWETKQIAITKGVYFKDRTTIAKGTKNESSNRIIYCDELVLELLKKHKAYQDKWLAKNHLANPHGYIFLKTRLNQAAMPTKAMFFHWLDSFLKKNNLPHIPVHSFRRMAASYYLSHNAPLTAVQEMLGHSSITTTNVYLRTLHKARKDSTDTMSKEFQSMIGTQADATSKAPKE